LPKSKKSDEVRDFLADIIDEVVWGNSKTVLTFNQQILKAFILYIEKVPFEKRGVLVL
jgi:hypothetical protein